MGSRLLEWYDVAEKLLHERLVVSVLADGRTVVATPDLDVYIEDLQHVGVGSDIVDVRNMGMAFSRPRDIAAVCTYEFGASSDDARTMSTAYEPSGVRYRKIKEATFMMEEGDIDVWPFRGPRTFHWLTKFICRYGGTPLSRHTRWELEAKMDESHPHVYVHEVFSELFELLLTLDMMEGASLTVAEQLARWHQDKKGSHERDESRGASDAYVSGLSRAAGGAAYCPSLRLCVTEQLGKDTAILKERRKAKEERELARKPAPAKK